MRCWRWKLNWTIPSGPNCRASPPGCNTWSLEYRAAEIADGPIEIADDAPVVSKDQRQRLELRSAARLTNYLLSHAQGKMSSGAELELQQEAKVNGIPAELFDVARRETRADTLAPTTGTGVNVDPGQADALRQGRAASAGGGNAQGGQRCLQHHDHLRRLDRCCYDGGIGV